MQVAVRRVPAQKAKNKKKKKSVPVSRRRNPREAKSNHRMVMSRNVTNLGGGTTSFTKATRLTVSHSEYVGDVTSTTNFATTIFRLNPGDSNSFPWLSSIALNFDKYEFRMLKYRFVSQSANALSSSNTSLGAVGMATIYDTTSPDFVSIQQMMQADNAIIGAPSRSTFHNVDVKSRDLPYKQYFVRPAGRDATNISDVGRTFIATRGMQSAGSQIGSIWVDYTVEFTKATADQAYGLFQYADHYVAGTTTGYILGESKQRGQSQYLPHSQSVDVLGSAGTRYNFPSTTPPAIYNYDYKAYAPDGAACSGQSYILTTNGNTVPMANDYTSAAYVSHETSPGGFVPLTYLINVGLFVIGATYVALRPFPTASWASMSPGFDSAEVFVKAMPWQLLDAIPGDFKNSIRSSPKVRTHYVLTKNGASGPFTDNALYKVLAAQHGLSFEEVASKLSFEAPASKPHALSLQPMDVDEVKSELYERKELEVDRFKSEASRRSASRGPAVDKAGGDRLSLFNKSS